MSNNVGDAALGDVVGNVTVVKVESLEEDPDNTAPKTADKREGKRKYLATVNKRICEAIKRLSERQEILEEFVHLEINEYVQSMLRYETNRHRLAYALNINKEEMVQGKDNGKVGTMIRLLRLANAYWKREKCQIHRPSNTDARLRYEGRIPQELAALRIHVDFETGFLGRKPIKRCHKCYDIAHEMKFCPFKRVEDRTPEVNAMIQQRFERLKEEEGNDPLLSKGYKKRHFKIDEKMERWKEIRETKKMKRMEAIYGDGEADT